MISKYHDIDVALVYRIIFAICTHGFLFTKVTNLISIMSKPISIVVMVVVVVRKS